MGYLLQFVRIMSCHIMSVLCCFSVVTYVLFAAVCANNVMSRYKYSVLFFSCRVCAMPQSASFVARFWSAFVSTTRRTGTCGQARKVGACFEHFVFCDKATHNDCTLVSLCVLSPLQESA